MNNPIKHHIGSWLLTFFPKWVLAVTIGRHIFFRNLIPPYWLFMHEEVHVRQYRENGIVGFLWIYFVKEWRLPYREKTFEKEAYQISSPPAVKTEVSDKPQWQSAPSCYGQGDYACGPEKRDLCPWENTCI